MRVLKIDAVSQMRVEYQNAIVHQARVQQAQRLREEIQSEADELEDAVKSAMCPFLVLEIRRDHLIEDTLNQIYIKVSGFDLRPGFMVLCSLASGERHCDNKKCWTQKHKSMTALTMRPLCLLKYQAQFSRWEWQHTVNQQANQKIIVSRPHILSMMLSMIACLRSEDS